MYLNKNKVYDFHDNIFLACDDENRLLRNRVSAQQARERKKAYVGDLEVRVKDLESKNAELEERLSTFQNENQMLRKVRFLVIIFFN